MANNSPSANPRPAPIAGKSPIFGTSGDDVLVGTGQNDQLFGGQGNDILIGGAGNNQLWGGAGNDILIGGKGSNLLVGGRGQDTMTGGGGGADTFLYNTDPFDGMTPAAAAGKIPNVNAPDTITDFTVGKDVFALSVDALGLKGFSFADGAVKNLSGGANVLVLQDQFANAGVAAQAIADNHALTAGAGVFIYHNSTLGINRLVFSSDLAKGGAFSVLANLTNQGGDAGVALLPTYTAHNFSVVCWPARLIKSTAQLVF